MRERVIQPATEQGRHHRDAPVVRASAAVVVSIGWRHP
jgi:hypothetical protein